MALGDKIEIAVAGGEKLRVREKDIEALHPGPLASPDDPPLAGAPGGALTGDVRGAWELLAGTLAPGDAVSLKELAELAYGEFSPQSAWAAYALLREGVYFSGTGAALYPRDVSEVEAEERKRDGKQRDALEREAFLERLKADKLILPGAEDSPDYLPSGRYTDPPGGTPSDLRFFQDVEALAWGKSAKSRTLKDLGRPETPEEAHRFLLSAGVWTPWVNPHPERFGVSAVSAKEGVAVPPAEARADLTGLRSYAIDNAYSADPDDAVSIEGPDTEGRVTLYVHIADPAASVLPGSPADLEARGRGATLYLPEGPARMFADEALPRFALGVCRDYEDFAASRPPGPDETSMALTFKLTLRSGGPVLDIEILPSRVNVTRLTYREADERAKTENPPSGTNPVNADPVAADLTALLALAEANVTRRVKAGAVMIDLPEAHISVDIPRRSIEVEADAPSPSADMVRECMLLAGEGAAHWASRRQLPFPFVCQETGDLPNDPLPGLAGSYQLRRCMRPRTLSVKPGAHFGLGLDEYTQVTSPLRRYTDLLAHQQIRAALGVGLYAGREPLTEDEVLFALSAGDAASLAVIQAERASRAHWMAVYLAAYLDKPDDSWDGVVLERKGPRALVSIPALGVETQIPLKTGEGPNEPVQLKLVSIRIPEAEFVFSA
jgi:exoribonuclease-2